MENLKKEFIAIVDKHQHLIYKICFVYSRNRAHLNDLYQESLLNLWKSYPNFRHESKTSTWIYRITLNTCISYFKRFITKSKFSPITEDIEGDVNNSSLSEMMQEVYALMNNLTEMERTIVLLYLEDKTYEEIAEITGISITNVGTKLNRIKKRLTNLKNQDNGNQ